MKIVESQETEIHGILRLDTELIERVSFVRDGKKYVIFTDGNSWYIPTLITNLLASAKVHEPEHKILVYCTDKEGYDMCSTLEFPHYNYVQFN